MHTDEVGTLKLLQRDFAEMRRLCAEHEGSVLKTTGDGLLLTFTSAVQAVACALAMQRQFAAEAKDPAAGDVLQHRIGIHLGDVLVQDKDVMGDGVNIAARLQSEAEPGGICISQTVYDVVKNKIEMQAVSLGARELKNIAQAMPVYRLLLEAHGLDPSGKAVPLRVEGKSKASRRIWAIAVCAAAVAAIAAFVILGHKAGPKGPVAAEPTAPVASPALVPAALPTETKKAEEPDIASDLSEDYGRRKDTFHELHALYLDKYDFNGLVLALRDKGESPSAPPELKLMLRSAEQLVRLRSWLESALRRSSMQHPLVASDLSGDASKDASVYLAADQRIVFMETGKPVTLDWSDIKPPLMGAIIMGAMHETKENRHPPVLAALTFARLYSLPQMTRALTTMKAHDEGSAPK
jgi:hypothetical protein